MKLLEKNIKDNGLFVWPLVSNISTQQYIVTMSLESQYVTIQLSNRQWSSWIV